MDSSKRVNVKLKHEKKKGMAAGGKREKEGAKKEPGMDREAFVSASAKRISNGLSDCLRRGEYGESMECAQTKDAACYSRSSRKVTAEERRREA